MGFIADIFGGGGQAAAAPNPFSPEAVAMRRMELESQSSMAREEAEFQRGMAREDREWQEDLEFKRSMRKQKEEEERIRALRDEQAEVNEQVDAMMYELDADTDEGYTQMWASLSNGVSSNRTASSTVNTDTKNNALDSAFSRFLRGAD
jgi:hypothetical protein